MNETMKKYTLTGEHCEKCGNPLAVELDGNHNKRKMCRRYNNDN